MPPAQWHTKLRQPAVSPHHNAIAAGREGTGQALSSPFSSHGLDDAHICYSMRPEQHAAECSGSHASSCSEPSESQQPDDEDASAWTAEERDGAEAHVEYSDDAASVLSEAEFASDARKGGADAQSARAWRLQRIAPPAGLSERDRFLLAARARAVFTMREWQEKTAELMRM